MTDFSMLSRAELIERLRALETRGGPPESAGSATASALQESMERLRAILETAVEGIITIDHRGIIESLNPAAEQIFGYTAGEVIGKNVTVLMPSPFKEHHDQYISNYLRTGEARIIGIGREVVGRRKDGIVFPMDLSVSEVRLASKRLFTGFVRDITDRKRAEAQIAQSDAALRKELAFTSTILDTLGALVVVLDDRGRVIRFNKAFERTIGCTLDEVRGRVFFDLFLLPEEIASIRSVFQRLAAGEPSNQHENHIRARDGSRRFVRWSNAVLMGGCGVEYVIGTGIDLTEQKQLEKEVLQISEKEQLRIGQDLHDGICQQLAGIALMSQALAQKLDRAGRPEAAKAGEIAGHVQGAIVQTRMLSRGLSPVGMAAEGLMSALAELAAGTRKIFGIECSFECPDQVLMTDNNKATHLYRISQEAITNAIKHGKATRIEILLDRGGGNILLSVRDNGSGIPPQAWYSSGMGLRIMQYRAGMIGASLEIGRNKDGGTEVKCLLSQPGD